LPNSDTNFPYRPSGEDPSQSVRWHEHHYPSPLACWNYHPEYEIHLIRKGTGKFIVGDHIGTFEAGHVSINQDLADQWLRLALTSSYPVVPKG